MNDTDCWNDRMDTLLESTVENAEYSGLLASESRRPISLELALNMFTTSARSDRAGITTSKSHGTETILRTRALIRDERFSISEHPIMGSTRSALSMSELNLFNIRPVGRL